MADRRGRIHEQHFIQIADGSSTAVRVTDQRGIAKLDVSTFEAKEFKEYEEFKKEPGARIQESGGQGVRHAIEVFTRRTTML